MISRAEQRRIGWRFNFSKTQWKAILGAADADAKKGAAVEFRPHHGAKLQARLLQAANAYLDDVSGKRKWRARSKQASAWAKVAKRMADARRAIVDAEDENEPMLGVHARLLDFEGMNAHHQQALMRAKEEGFPDYLGVKFEPLDATGPALHRRILALLEQWQRSAAVLHECFTDRNSRFSIAEQENPRMAFFRDVFNCWTMAGGALSYSRHPTTKTTRSREIQGPLVRYLQAVTQPVMGDDAPIPDTIRALIDREKKLRRRAAAAVAAP